MYQGVTALIVGILPVLLAIGETATVQPDSVYGPLVKQILSDYLDSCQVLLIQQGKDSPVFDWFLKSQKDGYATEVILDVDDTTLELGGDLWTRLKRGEDKFHCRVFVFDLITTRSNSMLALSLLEAMELFLIRNATIIFLGEKSHVKGTLRDRALRNTASALYLTTAPEKRTVEYSLNQVVKTTIQGKSSSPIIHDIPRVFLYSRCLFCNAGEMGIQLADVWTPEFGFVKNNTIIKDQFQNFMGHRFNIVTLDWFPIIDFKRDSNEISTTVTPRDSLAVRIVDVIAETLNFTYEMRVPWDNQWGIRSDGNWTGIMGTIQHNKADFTMLTAWVWDRYHAIDYSRVYTAEPILLATSKPRPLPPSLALVRPLPGSLWLAIFLSSLTAGFIFWLLQKGWAVISKDKGLSLNESVLFTWRILLEEPPKTTPSNVSGQMFVGWWWVYCTLISVIYKSLLIAHLSVPAMSRPIDNFDQLVRAGGWTWGYEPVFGAGWEWFKFNKNPVVQEVFQNIEVQEITEQMGRLLRGSHAVITFKYRIKSLIASSYTNRFGYTPVYTAKSEYLINFGYGWGFRKNAPFRHSIDMKKQRLIETGFITLWLNQLIDAAGREARKSRNDNDATSGKPAGPTLKGETTGQVVLSLHHLQSVFFVLFLGFSGASLSFLLEKGFHKCTMKSPTANTDCN